MPTSFNGTTTTVAASTSPQSVTGDDNRIGWSMTNASTGRFYLLDGTGSVSPTNYTVYLDPGDYFEVPFEFVGAVQIVWGAAATGNALVTVYT